MWPLGELLSTWGARSCPLYYKLPDHEFQNSLRGLKWERKKYRRTRNRGKSGAEASPGGNEAVWG